jgi:xanthosine utilization system XapX-like protein
MGVRATRAGLTIAAVATLVAIASPAPDAAAEAWGINGTYVATSNGQWSRTNEQFRDEGVVRSNWTISTTCVDPMDCTGTVHSDAGWDAPIYARSGMWYVKRAIPNWEPCPDGTFADGLQTFRFYAADPFTGQKAPTPSGTWLGNDSTNSASGSCGINKQLVINMPFNLKAP